MSTEKKMDIMLYLLQFFVGVMAGVTLSDIVTRLN